ncbi:MAG: type II toxin-antitoxin system PemK/MazF family toxin [Trichodesmium sp. St16_bin4-tuft]|nr:type II toxin-antitoxin system PemK/MazF family toxin [Trichodesmium sp. MAG_R01]MDE5077393.1 type II toxin-antitoxin system PemK/MazF family toxin [Trichodesmium sp. St2_bin6]MDE5096988.1 type II toxin-antitoxin system PemK/MazF family toxin [Trichodesmium sp. St16_bin4-tuft]MDE5103463.1 type II toxin-antitoxin system PemK/MazF family toxin [Trichodesmium sp. St19_bin2]
MLINQGDIFWIELGEPSGSKTSYRHPHVVIQNNVFNFSLINTVVVCSLGSNLKLAAVPGNIVLSLGEVNLPDQRVVNISQIFTVEKAKLIDKIGTLSPERIEQILNGVELLLKPTDMES